MSLRYEQHASLRRTREFLYRLLSVREYPATRREMRAEASACLRHFPALKDDGEPIFSKDNFKPAKPTTETLKG